MSRRTASEVAEAALDKLLSQRESARQRLAKLDEEIARMRGKLGGPMPVGVFPPVFEKAQPEPGLVLPENIAPADDMGEGRLL